MIAVTDCVCLLTDRYANRISDAQFRSAHPELFPNLDIDSDVESDVDLVNFISSNA